MSLAHLMTVTVALGLRLVAVLLLLLLLETTGVLVLRDIRFLLADVDASTMLVVELALLLELRFG
jgi:hypothetical protein